MVDARNPNANKGYVHMNFTLNNTEIDVDRNISPLKDQEAYYANVEKARTVLETVKAENGGTYDNLTPEVHQKLLDQGILILNVFEQIKDPEDPKAAEGEETGISTPPPAGEAKKKKKKPPQFRRQYMFRLASDTSQVPKQFYLE